MHTSSFNTSTGNPLGPAAFCFSDEEVPLNYASIESNFPASFTPSWGYELTELRRYLSFTDLFGFCNIAGWDGIVCIKEGWKIIALFLYHFVCDNLCPSNTSIGIMDDFFLPSPVSPVGAKILVGLPTRLCQHLPQLCYTNASLPSKPRSQIFF